MAQNITLLNASYSAVPAVTLPKTGGGTAQFDDTTDADATADDILTGKSAYINGVKVNGGIPIYDESDVEKGSDLTWFVAHDGYYSEWGGSATGPYATKSAVSNHSVTVTPWCEFNIGSSTNTKTGTAVSVAASELVSGSETKTANGTYDVTNLASLIVNVPSGSSKNVQIVQGTTRTNSSTATAIGAELTVSKAGTYDVYWSGFRTNTSASYTWGTCLYIDGTAYGTENTTWTNNQQNNHLTGLSLTANQKIRVYGRQTRGTSYYISAPTLIIIES